MGGKHLSPDVVLGACGRDLVIVFCARRSENGAKIYHLNRSGLRAEARGPQFISGAVGRFMISDTLLQPPDSGKIRKYVKNTEKYLSGSFPKFFDG